MAMKKVEELYGKEFASLLSKGLAWISQYSCYPPTHQAELNYNQTVIAAVLRALLEEDIEGLSLIHRVENLSYFQCLYMKPWLKNDHKFPKKVVAKILNTLAWLVVEEKLSPQSQLVAAVTGLEKKYHLFGVFVQTAIVCAKRTRKMARYNGEIEKEAPDVKSVSTQTTLELNESFSEFNQNGDGATPLEPAENFNITEIDRTHIHGGSDIKGKTIEDKTLLQCAFEQESANTVDTLLKLCGDVKKDKKSISELLTRAVKKNRIRLLRTLLWHGVDTQSFDEDGNAPLHIAASLNYARIVRLLTSVGASVTQANQSGLLPLHMTNDPKIIIHLLQKGTDVDATTPSGDTALHIAAASGNEEAVKTLVRFGARLDAINGSGLTPLLIALHSYNKEMVELLIGQGAVVTEFSSNLEEPMENVAAKDRLETIMEVTEEEEIANEGNTEGVTNSLELEACEASINDGYDSPYTLAEELTEGLIHKTAMEGQLESVKVVPEEKNIQRAEMTTMFISDVTEIVGSQASQIDDSVKTQNLDVEGAHQDSSNVVCVIPKILVADLNEDEPILEAEAEGRLEAVEISEQEKTYHDVSGVQKSEASLEPKTDCVKTQEPALEDKKDGPIHKAASEGRLESVIELLDEGVHVDCKGWGGYTPLQYAAKYGHLDIVQFLIHRGADINLGNDYNWTPLHHAAHYSRYNIAEFLINAGADTQIVDNVYGKTPFSWATYNNKIIRLFKSKGIYN